jgi:hypothetical protein
MPPNDISTRDELLIRVDQKLKDLDVTLKRLHDKDEAQDDDIKANSKDIANQKGVMAALSAVSSIVGGIMASVLGGK